MKASIGIIGIGTMGKNLSLNLIDNEFTTAIYDVNSEQVDSTIQSTPSEKLVGTYSLEEFFESLTTPRKIILMVKAGKVTDTVLNNISPFLEKGDVVVDGGNADFRDTARRVQHFKKNNIYYIGAGISGGAAGARKGPSIMPGGNKKGWSLVKQPLQAIAAKSNGRPCCQWIGPGGAGHYVKTVHNGIEYGDMELIAETYDILRQLTEYDVSDISKIFKSWNQGKLNSFLIEITGSILTETVGDTGKPLVDLILDHAGQKGTGKWTVYSALKLGMPSTIIASAVFQRFLSAQKSQRLQAATEFSHVLQSDLDVPDNIVEIIENALYSAKLLSYAQGYTLLTAASESYGWELDLADISHTWSNGCIIRSTFLDKIAVAYSDNPSLDNIILYPDFKQDLLNYISDLREIVKICVEGGISSPAYNTAISYFDGYRAAKLPANIIQAQRDYFGSHGFVRIDQDSDQKYSHQWNSF